MRNVTTALRSTVRSIGDWQAIDTIADAVSGLVTKITGPTPVKNLLSGTFLGHPLHPALTDVPIGAWLAATTLDVAAGEQGARAAQTMVGLGVLAAVPTGISGSSDWSTTYGPDKRIGLVHAVVNITATTLQAASWAARRRGSRGQGALLSLVGLGLTLGSAYLGGHLTLSRGVGVNHTAFEEPAEEWTDVAAEADLQAGSLTRVEVDGVPVVLIRKRGQLHALSAVCTHAGGPLDEGTLDASGCVTCPWHGSRFRIEDGGVERGPASEPAPRWDVKVEGGRVLVRA
ncbi:hypothetical protein GCM10022240_13960 [Microbacterium kribbense]|uniref:Rieske domain-containing protein n=1 Tax=Microbacterium kribbense TaxID=433645 RepID=A0ABP7GFV7_9MICO